MSGNTIATAERRISIFVLRPVSIAFATGAWLAISRRLWWGAVIGVLLIAYIAWLDSKSHQSSYEVPVGFAATTELTELSPEQERHLVEWMIQVLYAIVIATIVVALGTGMKVFWALLLGIMVWLVGQSIVGVIVAIVSTTNWSHRNAKPSPAESDNKLGGSIYGNSPPKKSADLEAAIQFAYQDLLRGAISKEQLTETARAINEMPVRYSTEELALVISLAYFAREEFIERLRHAQLFARTHALKWAQANKVTPKILKTFEDTLYQLYKPEGSRRTQMN